MSISLPHISQIILAGSVGFVCGVAFALFFNVSVDVVLFIVAICVIGGFVIFYKTSSVWIALVGVLMFGIGILIADDALKQIAYKDRNVGTVFDGEAIVIEDVVQKKWNANVIVQYVSDDMTVLIKDEKYTQVNYGDVLNLQCTSILPENYQNFDYQKYLAMKGIDYICEDFEYHIIGHKETILSRLSQMRIYMENIVNTIIPAPQSALANGLLFGGDDRLSDEMQEKFAVTGMTHIVAVSGYNVSIIIVVVMGFVMFAGVKRQYAVGFAVTGIIIFVALIGFPSSGVRAAIMGILVLIAASYGRVSHAYGAIFFTGAVMLAFNPLLLRYDIGFQLSFLATLGIVVVYPILEKYFATRKTAFGIVEIFLLTISAQVFVLPVIAYHFHTLSIVSLPANVLILPIIPITMFLVFFMIIMNMIFHPIAIFFGWVAYFLLLYEIKIIDLFAKMKWSSMDIESVHIVWFILYYIILIGVVCLIDLFGNSFQTMISKIWRK